jgi:hypothetical protein
MTKPTNHGKAWTAPQVKQLRSLAKGNTPTRVIALKLNRTPAAVAAKQARKNLSEAHQPKPARRGIPTGEGLHDGTVAQVTFSIAPPVGE